MSLFTERVTLHLPGGPTGDYDDLGNPITAPDRDVVSRAWCDQRESSEAVDAREQRVWGYWLYLPLTAPAADGMTVTLPHDGQVYRIQGEPSRQPGGYIVEGYIRMSIERWAG